MFSLSMIIEKLSVKKMLKIEFYARCVFVRLAPKNNSLAFLQKDFKMFRNSHFIF